MTLRPVVLIARLAWAISPIAGPITNAGAAHNQMRSRLLPILVLEPQFTEYTAIMMKPSSLSRSRWIVDLSDNVYNFSHNIWNLEGSANDLAAGADGSIWSLDVYGKVTLFSPP